MPPGKSEGGGPPSAVGKRLFPKSAPRRQVPAKEQKNVTLIGAIFCVVFISIGWYYLIIRPHNLQMQAEMDKMQAALVAAQQQAQAAQDAQKKAADVASQKGGLTLKTDPAGATVLVGGETSVQTTDSALNIPGLSTGKKTIQIQLNGYEPASREVEIVADKFIDLGTITLVSSRGTLNITSTTDGAAFTLSNDKGVVNTGQIPATLQLPVGKYNLVAKLVNNEFNETFEIKRQETTESKVAFATGSLTLTSDPSSALVKEGDTELGRTPLNLPQLPPVPKNLTFSLPGYKPATITAQIEPNKALTIRQALEIDHDFNSSSGLRLVWLPADYWVGQTEVTQAEFENVMGGNPSECQGRNKPVENVSWNDAVQFCKLLTQFDAKTGVLPAGFAYRLPLEREWEYYVADSDLDNSITSRDASRKSPEDVASLKPNKFGLYDVRGNVWEWCLNSFDTSNQLHSMRGGGWLTFKPEDLDLGARNGAPPDYHDKFVGFRPVLVRVIHSN